MTKTPVLMFALVLLAGALAASASPPVDSRETKALEAAEAWLARIDAGEYDESWEEAAALFKAAVSKEQWARSLSAARGPLGGIVSRELESSRVATELPGAPDGEYVVLQFETSFENKSRAVETVTPMLDPDGEWRVAGYYIK